MSRKIHGFELWTEMPLANDCRMPQSVIFHEGSQ